VNGIEYFTIVATGESGLSTTGIAKTVGVSKQAVSALVKSVQNSVSIKSLPESLQPLHGKALQCQLAYKNIQLLNADSWACIADYYAHDAQVKTTEAIKTYRAFGRIGATSYIQGVTGWLPIGLQSSKESRTALDRILDDATPYKVFYEPLLYEKAVKLMGVGFYWHYCYDFLTADERCKLNRVNEQTPNGRVRYIHQHISPIAREKLEKYLIRLAVLVKQANTRQEFNVMYQYQFYDNRQLGFELPND